MRLRPIERGDVFLLRPRAPKGKRPAGARLVVAVQNDLANALAPATIVAAVRSGIRRGLPVHVAVPGTRGLPAGSVVDCGMLATVASRSLGARLARLSSPCMARVDQALKTALSLR